MLDKIEDVCVCAIGIFFSLMLGLALAWMTYFSYLALTNAAQ